MQQLPSYAIPIFGTFSFASILGLIVLLLKFREDTSKAFVELVMKSDRFQTLLGTLLTKESAEKVYVSKETYRDHHARLKHLEASCQNCTPLKETKGLRREEL